MLIPLLNPVTVPDFEVCEMFNSFFKKSVKEETRVSTFELVFDLYTRLQREAQSEHSSKSLDHSTHDRDCSGCAKTRYASRMFRMYAKV